jgi:mannose-1-phosphate guanylyltransferase/mannose-6-phosphate isomerase
MRLTGFMTQLNSADIQRAQPLANLYGMIICSNSAAHLWPLSRERAPLELIPNPADGLSPLAKIIEAVRPYCKKPLLISAPHDMAPYVENHIIEHALLDAGDYRILAEPHPRGEALTIALAAATMKLTDPHALLLCIPATLAFENDDRWEQTLKRAHRAAEAGKIALIGSSVAPITRVSDEQNHSGALYAGRETNKTPPLLGAIRVGPQSRDMEGVYQVQSFIARPAPVIAWRAQQGKSLWSTRIFMLRADLVLAELRAAGREATDPLMQSVQRIAETARFFASLGNEHLNSREAGELVETLPTFSFEEAVFETTKLLAAIPTSIPFFDLATLGGYEQSVEADAYGNRLRGRTLALQTRDSTVLADGNKLVVALGIENALVIDTADATLVTTKDALASMPSVIAALKGIDAREL